MLIHQQKKKKKKGANAIIRRKMQAPLHELCAKKERKKLCTKSSQNCTSSYVLHLFFFYH